MTPRNPHLPLLLLPRAGDETKVTRRDETRDGLASFVSRLIVTRRDEIRDQVKKKKILAQIFLQISRLKCYFFFRDRKFNSRPSCATKSRDETRSRWSRLVSSRFFSRRDRLVTGPSFAKRYLWVTSWLYVVRRNLKSNSKLFPHVTASCVANFAPCLWQSVACVAPPPFQEKGFQRRKGWNAFSLPAFSLPRLTVFPRAHSIKIRGEKEEGARPSTYVRICVERGPARKGEPAS